jgi:predicted nucleic acid-binding protein
VATPLSVFYWDACIFYEYCRDDQPDVAKSQAITELLSDNRDKRNRICTSVFTHAEVIPNKLGEEAEKKYQDCFGSLFFFDVEISRNDVLLAREIRDYYYKPATDGAAYRMLSMGDALHLATAIHQRAEEFHTRDGNRKGGNIALLGLDEASPGGKLCGKYELKIRSPMATEIKLFP